MKKQLRFAAALALCLCSSLATSQAQFGGQGGSPGSAFGGSMAKLFGDNTTYSATLDSQVKSDSGGDPMSVPAKLTYDQGKTRFEMDLTKASGIKIPPQALTQMKAMGMDVMVMISRPDKKMAYIVYPGMKAYVEMPMSDTDAATKPDQFKLETTELSKETVDGHSCVKNKQVVTDDKGKTNEYTAWNAADLKKFPVKIEMTEKGQTVSLSFKDIKFDKVEAAQFETPAGFTKYDSMQAMMQGEMMKRMPQGGAGGN